MTEKQYTTHQKFFRELLDQKHDLEIQIRCWHKDRMAARDE